MRTDDMEQGSGVGEIAIYEAEPGTFEAPVKEETDWLTQAQMGELFQRDQSVISRHIRNASDEGELERESNMQKMHIASSDKPVTDFTQDVIINCRLLDEAGPWSMTPASPR